MDKPANTTLLAAPLADDVAQLDAGLAGLVTEMVQATEPSRVQELAASIAEMAPRPPEPSEARREVDAFVMRANTCRDPDLAWRAADAPLRLRDVMLHRHPWLREVFPPLPPPPIGHCSGLRPSRAPRRTCTRSRARRAARRGLTRAGPDDDDPDDSDGPPPRLSDGGAA